MRSFASTGCTWGRPATRLVAGVHHAADRARNECKGSATRCHATKVTKDARREPSSPLPMPIKESVERLVVTPVIREAPWVPERLQQQEQNPKACILFISESDVCRSVLAGACLQQMLREEGMEGAVRVATCGTRPYNVGEEPEPATAVAAEALGIELPSDHAARLFEPAVDIVAYDMLLTMDKFTTGDVMREVSSFDLVNRTSQFSYKVRRLGEFLGGPANQGSAAMYGGDGGSEMDIEDPLYGNVGGEEEERAVLQAATTIREACRGLVVFLRSLQEEALGSSSRGGPQAAQEESGMRGADEELACELPVPGQAPVCSSDSTSDTDTEGEEAGAHHSAGPALGPALRARVLTMGPTPWLVPPMLSPRSKTPNF